MGNPNSFVFKCKHCDESFVIHFDFLAKDSLIVCPNCKHKLIDEAAKELQLSVIHLQNALNILQANNIEPDGIFKFPYSFTGDGFELKILWNDLGFMPFDQKKD